MSGLRKRSPRLLPVTGLLLGALSLGLAGCGGGGNNDFDITQPITVTPRTSVPVDGTQASTAGQTATSGNTSGGVTNASVTLTQGGLSLPIGIELISGSQSLLATSGDDDADEFIPIAEIIIGAVSGGSINLGTNSGLTSGSLNVTLQLTPAEFQNIQTHLQNGQSLQVRVVSGTGNDAALTIAPGASISLGQNNTLIVRGIGQGDFVIVQLTVDHRQVGLD